MITSGFKNAVSQMLSNGDTAKGLLPIKDVSGTTVYLAGYDDFPYDVETGFTLTASAAGISVGSGSTAATENDYQLETPITSGLTGVVTVDKGVESGDAYITLNITLTNTSGSSISVSEICYKQEFKVAATQSGTTTSSAVCMVDRSVLDTALTIAASGQAVLTYKLKAAISSGGGTLVTKSVTANGTYDPQDDNADGYSLVTVAVQPNVGTKNIGANGTYNASSDSLDGYSQVTVSVSPNVGTKSITQNGTYNASSDSLDGYSQVSVNVSGGSATLIEKTITRNGTYNASGDSADGYSKVVVKVEGGEGTPTNFAYTGNIQTYTVPSTGKYKLEVWGAQGGSGNSDVHGGYGGYSVGMINLTQGDTLYVCVGGKGGGSATGDTSVVGYNGGGEANFGGARGNGGGATHIALVTGLLNTLSNNLSDILIVAGGGGGAGFFRAGDDGDGGSGGGYIGGHGLFNGSTTGDSNSHTGSGGTQSTGGETEDYSIQSIGSFGQGANRDDRDLWGGSAGGGGLYGGGASTNNAGAGGGSGYIAGLSDACMYGYNVQTSSSANTKTVSVSLHSDSPIALTAKEGNGYATITPIAATYEKATPDMTSDTTPSGVVTASSQYDSDHAKWYAFSSFCGGDYYTWATDWDDVVGAWIQYEFPTATKITKLVTVNRNEANNRAVGTFKLQGSNDGTTFTDIATCVIDSDAGHYRKEFYFDNDTAYLYYRLYVVSPYTQGESIIGFARVELYKEV